MLYFTARDCFVTASLYFSPFSHSPPKFLSSANHQFTLCVYKSVLCKFKYLINLVCCSLMSRIGERFPYCISFTWLFFSEHLFVMKVTGQGRNSTRCLRDQISGQSGLFSPPHRCRICSVIHSCYQTSLDLHGPCLH